MAFTVGDLAKLTGVTVRALHHYDDIGLVRPSERTAAGYRLYTDADVHRLQQVLLFRQLGMPLDEIASAIDQVDGREELLKVRKRSSSSTGNTSTAGSIRAAKPCTKTLERCTRPIRGSPKT